MQILKYPDSRLRQKSTQILSFDEDLHKILDEMYETMMQSGGIGLAAIQVGLPIKALIINIPREDEEHYKEDTLEIINPSFLATKGLVIYQEGCLSVPGFYEEIERFEEVSIAYQNRFGEEKILQASELLAIAIQHEMDHLEGILFVDKLPILRRKKFEQELKKLQKEQKFKSSSTQGKK